METPPLTLERFAKLVAEMRRFQQSFAKHPNGQMARWKAAQEQKVDKVLAKMTNPVLF